MHCCLWVFQGPQRPPTAHGLHVLAYAHRIGGILKYHNVLPEAQYFTLRQHACACVRDNGILRCEPEALPCSLCRTAQDAMLIGADYYESEEQRKALFEAGRIPMGIGENSVISNTIVDKNARIGKNCRIINKDGIEEANREARPGLGSRCICPVLRTLVWQVAGRNTG